MYRGTRLCSPPSNSGGLCVNVCVCVCARVWCARACVCVQSLSCQFFATVLTSLGEEAFVSVHSKFLFSVQPAMEHPLTYKPTDTHTHTQESKGSRQRGNSPGQERHTHWR